MSPVGLPANAPLTSRGGHPSEINTIHFSLDHGRIRRFAAHNPHMADEWGACGLVLPYVGTVLRRNTWASVAGVDSSGAVRRYRVRLDGTTFSVDSSRGDMQLRSSRVSTSPKPLVDAMPRKLAREMSAASGPEQIGSQSLKRLTSPYPGSLPEGSGDRLVVSLGCICLGALYFRVRVDFLFLDREFFFSSLMSMILRAALLNAFGDRRSEAPYGRTSERRNEYETREHESLLQWVWKSPSTFCAAAGANPPRASDEASPRWRRVRWVS